MPKVTKRAKIRRELRQWARGLLVLYAMDKSMLYMSLLDGPGAENVNPLQLLSPPEDAWLDMWASVACFLAGIERERYMLRGPYGTRSHDWIHNFFESLPHHKFRQITRVDRPTFEHIVELVQNHHVFHSSAHYQQQPVRWQVAATLDRLENDGQGTSFGRSEHLWGVGYGTITLYMKRVIRALLFIQNEWVFWPNSAARSEISRRMARVGFPNCVGFVDGTVFPLHRKPAHYGHVFMDRKKNYSINAQVTCDDMNRITNFVVGCPGSVHDSKAFSSSVLVVASDTCFQGDEYILADSGYAASTTVVPAYKENARERVSPEERLKCSEFNTFLAKARAVNEHTIGILKSRWSSLWGLRIDLNKRHDLHRINRHCTACAVLHNIAIRTDPWEDDEDLEDLHGTYPTPDLTSGNLSWTEGQQKRLRVRDRCLEIQARVHASRRPV